MTTMQYDLIVIGAGPAGEVGAIRAAQLGQRVAIIEKREHLGGTCLNVGCIPTKALLHSAALYEKIKESAKEGFTVQGLAYDWQSIMQRKERIVNQMRKGLDFLIKKNNIDRLQGLGKMVGPHEVVVTQQEGESKLLIGKHILLATGSQVRQLSAAIPNGRNILTSDELLEIDAPPASMAVIGGGVVGMEFASLFGRMGTKVTVIEFAEEILPYEDRMVVAELKRYLKRQNVKILTSSEVVAVHDLEDHCRVEIKGKEPETFTKVLSSVGRVPYTDGLGLESLGIDKDEGGFVKVNQHYNTNVDSIWAVGDIIKTPALAHTASAEALYAVEYMFNHKPISIDYSANPSAVYTWPEIASIGATEEKLIAQGKEYKVAKFPFSALAKANIEGAAMGFIKLLTDPVSNKLLGVHIIGAKATELISEFALAKVADLPLETIGRTIHPHPTIAEGMMEAAHAGLGGAIHL